MTTTTKHTPGPWLIQLSSRPGNGSAWRDIVSTGTEFFPSYVGEALEPDARLFAAAPDLLAALEHCCAVMADCVMFPERDDENRAYSQARAAIAKATADV